MGWVGLALCTVNFTFLAFLLGYSSAVHRSLVAAKLV
jgi:hypothetical protein